MPGLKDETRAKLMNVSTPTLCSALYKLGLRNQFIQDVRPLNPGLGNMVGEAYTVRYIPAREDLNPMSVFENREHPQRKAVEECPPGAVLVFDSRKDARAASAGGILVSRLMKRGVAGVVTDGGFRDSPEIAKLAIPAYHHRPSAPTNLTLHQAIDINVPIGCGDVPVWPGDVLVGDGEGVVVIPAHLVDDVATEAVRMTEFEDFVTEEVLKGRSILGLYPATDPETVADFAAWRAARRGQRLRHDRSEKLGRARQSSAVTASTAALVADTTMSASSLVRQRGGAKPRMSPWGMARPMTPRSSRAAVMRGPTFSDASKKTRSSRSRTNSTAASNPSPRTSPTKRLLAHRILQRRLEIGADIRRIGDEAELVDELEVRDPGRRAERMRGIGPAMPDGAEGVGTLLEDPPQLLRHDDARQGRVGGCQPLRDGDQIGRHAVVVRPEHRAEAPEARDDLVGDQQDVVPGEDGLDLLPVTLRRRHDAARAEHRLADEGRDGLRRFGQDQLVEPVGAKLRERLFAHATGRAAGSNTAPPYAGSAAGAGRTGRGRPRGP